MGISMLPNRPYSVLTSTHKANKPARKLYALDQHGRIRQSILERLHKEHVKENAYSISRFKGLGEMNP